MSLRSNEEKSYRTLLLGIISKVALNATREGLQAKLAGNEVEALQCALDAMDLVKTGNWLKALDESLCPDVEESTVESMIQYMKDRPIASTADARADLIRKHPDLEGDITAIEELLKRTEK